jgi:hypothetical protein
VRKLIITTALALVAAVSVSAMAFGAVTFDPATGNGFVGKGDVQLALGYNNAQLQNAANSGAISFSYASEVSYSQDCIKENRRQTIEKTFKTTRAVNAAVTGSARKNSQLDVTGFNLTGHTSATPSAPTDLCTPGVGQGEDANGWTPADGSVVTETGRTGGLLVNGVPLQ